MNTLSEEISKVFNDVQQEISQNVSSIMKELLLNWSHLGVDDDTKILNIRNLALIEKQFCQDVISGTRFKFEASQDQVDSVSQTPDA